MQPPVSSSSLRSKTAPYCPVGVSLHPVKRPPPFDHALSTPLTAVLPKSEYYMRSTYQRADQK